MEAVDNFIIFETQNEAPELVTLATDITFSTNSREVEKKLQQVREGIYGPPEKLKPKYLPIDGASNELWLPHVVIAVDKNTVEELAGRWVGKQSAQKEKKDRNTKALEAHEIQLQILDEIFIQCQYFKEIAKRLGKTQLADNYEKMETKFWYLLAEKLAEAGLQYDEFVNKDAGYHELMTALSKLDPELSFQQ